MKDGALERSDSSDAGFTLIEVLVAVAILAVGVVALLGGLASSVYGSSLHRNQAINDDALVSAAETVKADPYLACVTPGAGTQLTYNATPASGLYSTWKTNPSPVVANTAYFTTSVQFWTVTPTLTGFETVTAATGCPTYDDELVTITAFAADGKSSQSITVVKGNRSSNS